MEGSIQTNCKAKKENSNFPTYKDNFLDLLSYWVPEKFLKRCHTGSIEHSP